MKWCVHKMKKMILILMVIGIINSIFVTADLTVTVDMDSGNGEIDAWINANSGTGITNYYIDGLNYEQTQKDSARHRVSSIKKIYNSFMQWRLQPIGSWGWSTIEFNSLEPTYQRLRYVLEMWFVPRTELVKVINNQQTQITQLQLEIESIQRVLNEDDLCNARQEIMLEQNLTTVRCGSILTPLILVGGKVKLKPIEDDEDDYDDE